MLVFLCVLVIVTLLFVTSLTDAKRILR